MKGYLKERISNLIGNIDPSGIPWQTGDKRFPLNFIKEVAASHEEFELLKHDNVDRFSLKHTASGRFVCLNGFGDWETRENVGGDETFVVTIQPDKPEILFVYRRDEFGQLIDVVEFVRL